MRSNRKHSLLFGITSRTLMTISAALLLLSYFSSYVNPAKAWFMTIFGLLYAPLLIVNLILFAWALLRRSRAILIPLVALIPSIFLAGKYFRLDSDDDASVDGLKIISYNVGRFALPQTDKFGSWKECADSLLEFLKTRDADIICLQEFYAGSPKELESYLESGMKGYNVNYYVNMNSHSCSGNVTLSRFPVVSKGRIDFEKSSNLAFYSDYKINGEEFRVYNCHFQSYSISLPHLAKLMESDYRKAVKETEEKMKNSIILRPRQVDMVMDNIENSPKKAIVTGDFNDTPMSYTYYRLSRTRKDSFEEAGSGSGATYSRFRPFLRIDYVLFPEEYEALSHRVIHKEFSDHYPIETVINVKE